MPKFEKGRAKTGGRKKGVATIKAIATQAGIVEWARSLFEDERYRASIAARLYKGRLPPQVECKLLAYAYGEPVRELSLNATLRGVVSVVHEHVALAPSCEPIVEALPPETPGSVMTPTHESVITPGRGRLLSEGSGV